MSNINTISAVDSYISGEDWRTKENANTGYSFSGMANNLAGKVMASYWLDKVFSAEEGAAHREGDYHIHDLGGIAPYCAGWNLRDFLEEGFTGVAGRIASRPPKHLDVAIGQMSNFLSVMASEWMGASAFNSFDTYLAPYVRLEHLSYGEVKQNLQQFVYNCNIPNRAGFQSPFTNITLDIIVPDDLRDQNPVIGGEICDFTYGDLQEEITLINLALVDVYMEGDADGRPFTFPIPTYSITEDFDWDAPVVNRIFDMTAKYGLPYFQNFINSDMNPSDVRSMCCRLSLDLKELRAHSNTGLFGASDSTGSIGVVTINMARLGYLYKGDEEGLYARLDHLLTLSSSVLVKRREVVTQLLDKNFYPYTKHYLGTYDNHFSSIGINGMNELIRNFTSDAEDITTAAGEELAYQIIMHIRERLVDFQEETGNLYNLEYTPSEGATYRFAKEDKKRYADILQAGSPEEPYYTNSALVPVNYTEDVFEALDINDRLQTLATGGTVFHVYTGDSIKNGKTAKLLIQKICHNYKLPFLSITPTYSICHTHGYLAGELFECPKCGDSCEVWTRVMGYFRPVQSFNIGKKGEFNERDYYVADSIL